MVVDWPKHSMVSSFVKALGNLAAYGMLFLSESGTFCISHLRLVLLFFLLISSCWEELLSDTFVDTINDVRNVFFIF